MRLCGLDNRRHSTWLRQLRFCALPPTLMANKRQSRFSFLGLFKSNSPTTREPQTKHSKTITSPGSAPRTAPGPVSQAADIPSFVPAAGSKSPINIAPHLWADPAFSPDSSIHPDHNASRPVPSPFPAAQEPKAMQRPEQLPPRPDTGPPAQSRSGPALGSIDELDESAFLPFHVVGPYEAIRRAAPLPPGAQPPQKPRRHRVQKVPCIFWSSVSSYLAQVTPAPAQLDHVPFGGSLNLQPGQVIPSNFQPYGAQAAQHHPAQPPSLKQSPFDRYMAERARAAPQQTYIPPPIQNTSPSPPTPAHRDRVLPNDIRAGPHQHIKQVQAPQYPINAPANVHRLRFVDRPLQNNSMVPYQLDTAPQGSTLQQAPGSVSRMAPSPVDSTFNAYDGIEVDSTPAQHGPPQPVPLASALPLLTPSSNMTTAELIKQEQQRRVRAAHAMTQSERQGINHIPDPVNGPGGNRSLAGPDTYQVHQQLPNTNRVGYQDNVSREESQQDLRPSAHRREPETDNRATPSPTTEIPLPATTGIPSHRSAGHLSHTQLASSSYSTFQTSDSSLGPSSLSDQFGGANQSNTSVASNKLPHFSDIPGASSPSSSAPSSISDNTTSRTTRPYPPHRPRHLVMPTPLQHATPLQQNVPLQQTQPTRMIRHSHQPQGSPKQQLSFDPNPLSRSDSPLRRASSQNPSASDLHMLNNPGPPSNVLRKRNSTVTPAGASHYYPKSKPLPTFTATHPPSHYLNASMAPKTLPTQPLPNSNYPGYSQPLQPSGKPNKLPKRVLSKKRHDL